MIWVVIVIVLVLLVALYIFFDQEIYFYEGTHLGSRIQAWLYDKWAAKYDSGKSESQARDREMLAQPILEFCRDIPSPLVLDLATGTGRLPLALLREPAFTGHIIALDVSQGMLQQAALKLQSHQGRFELLRHLDFPLPFPDHSFDVVCCMEALEVMPNIEDPLGELYRILRPGGMLVSSRATPASGRKAKVRSVDEFRAILEQVGFSSVEIVDWWRVFDRVLARKPGQSQPVEKHSLADILVCPQCKTAERYRAVAGGVECQACHHRVVRLEDGIFLN